MIATILFMTPFINSGIEESNRLDDPVSFTDREIGRILRHSPLSESPPPDSTNAVYENPAASRLGHALFFETRLSRSGEISCATCHDPQKAFTDGKALALGASEGTRHTPTILNAAYQRWWFWDGRADSLWSQALSPIEASHEMDGSRWRVARLILKDASYRQMYESLFGEITWALPSQEIQDAKPGPDPTHPDHRAWIQLEKQTQEGIDQLFAGVGKAIAAYERLLVSRKAPFDHFVEDLRQDPKTTSTSMSDSAKRGLKIFIGKGECRLCHEGPLFSDGAFHSVRVAPTSLRLRDSGRYGGIPLAQENPFNARSPFSDDRQGDRARRLSQLRRNPESWGEFRTPSLRNVALTAPYMHQGQFESLDRVLEHYSTFEGALSVGHHGETTLQPLYLTDQEKQDLKAFLESLTDFSIPKKWLSAPGAKSLGSKR